MLCSMEETFFINQLWMITTGQGYYYTTVDRLKLFKKKHHKMIPIDLSKNKALDSDPKAIQQINFAGNLSDNNNIIMFLMI